MAKSVNALNFKKKKKKKIEKYISLRLHVKQVFSTSSQIQRLSNNRTSIPRFWVPQDQGNKLSAFLLQKK